MGMFCRGMSPYLSIIEALLGAWTSLFPPLTIQIPFTVEHGIKQKLPSHHSQKEKRLKVWVSICQAYAKDSIDDIFLDTRKEMYAGLGVRLHLVHGLDL